MLKNLSNVQIYFLQIFWFCLFFFFSEYSSKYFICSASSNLCSYSFLSILLPKIVIYKSIAIGKNIKNIVVDVFGDGDYVENFVNELVDNELTNFIKYKGKTNDSTYHIRRHDALVDFTLNHSFGMTYIEGILSGKSVYCMKNTGSIEVMEGIPNSFIESYEDLVNKINKLPTISVEQLQENYRKIEEKYSRKIIAKKFIEYIDRGAKNE